MHDFKNGIFISIKETFYKTKKSHEKTLVGTLNILHFDMSVFKNIFTWQ